MQNASVSPVVSSFSFNGMNIRVVVLDDSEIAFVLKDAADVLGYSTTQKASQLLERQQLEGEPLWLPLPTAGGAQKTRCIRESELYALIMASEKQEAVPFRKWVYGEVLPSIRKTGSYQAATAEHVAPVRSKTEEKLHLSMALSKFAFETLNYSNVSKLKTIRKLHGIYGLDDSALDPYVIDAPSDSPGLSSEPVDSLTRILKQENSKVSIQKANKILIKLGILEEKTRVSRKDPSGTKSYKAISKAGLIYGRNDVSDQNPNETQPHWYLCKAKELVKLIEENV